MLRDGMVSKRLFEPGEHENEQMGGIYRERERMAMMPVDARLMGSNPAILDDPQNRSSFAVAAAAAAAPTNAVSLSLGSV